MNRRPCVGVVIGLAIGACISIPTFKGGDGGVDGSTCTPDVVVGPGSVSFAPDNGGGLVTAAGRYSIHFAPGAQFHFPDDIRIGSGAVDVMNPRETLCAPEDLAGMALFPAAAIRPNGAAPVGANELIPQTGWTGPAVVKVITHWSADYTMCSATPGGDSLFTLFPEGRVVRHDTLFSNQTVMWNTCGCDAGSSFFPTTYWTFDKASFMTVYAGSNEEPVASFTNSTIQNEPTACLQSGGGGATSVAIAWRVGPTEGTRVRGLANTIALVFDFIDVHVGQTTQNAFTFSTTSAVFLGGDCTAALQRANEFRGSGAELLINGIPRRPARADGIYGGADTIGNVGGYDVGSMTAGLTGTVPAFFAVWLRFPAVTCDIKVTKVPDPMNVFFAKQKIDDDEWVIWFRDSLANGETITVEAR